MGRGLKHFYGQTLVIKLSGNKYKELSNGISHWIISKEEIQERLDYLNIKHLPNKILITTENYPENTQGFHNPNYVLTLSQEAADFLVLNDNFDLYGTTWKSSDFNPGKSRTQGSTGRYLLHDGISIASTGCFRIASGSGVISNSFSIFFDSLTDRTGPLRISNIK